MIWPCHRLLFGLALAQGAASVLLWAAGQSPSGSPYWHVHELVFGHALAVIGGFLLTRLTKGTLLTVASVWMIGRLGYLLPLEPGGLRAVLSAASTVAVVLPAANAFLRGAKRPGSFVFPIVVLCFVAAEVLFQLGDLAILPSSKAGAWMGLGLVVLLIAAMGGRLVGAAASGAAQRRGGTRIAPSPRLDMALLGMLALGFSAKALGLSGLVAPLALAAAAVFLGSRVVFWWPGLRWSAGDVLAVATGQAWLAIGLAASAAAELWLLAIPPSAALHLATIGGIGTTTLVMAMRTSAQREARPMPARAALLVAALVSAAAVLRAFGPTDLHIASALSWGAATLLSARSVFARR